MKYKYKGCIDGNTFIELNVTIQKYLGRPSEKVVNIIHGVITTILDACGYTWELNETSEYDCSHIAGKKSIKIFEGQLLVDIDNILQKYIGEFSKPLATAIFELIVVILDIYGYKPKVTKDS
jgi:hypothetical protein